MLRHVQRCRVCSYRPCVPCRSCRTSVEYRSRKQGGDTYPTAEQLTALALWHADVDPAGALGVIAHIPPILLAAGLRPRMVEAVMAWCLVAPASVAEVDEVTLMACAHLSTLAVLSRADIAHMSTHCGWTVPELVSWSLAFPSGHLSRCLDLGLTFERPCREVAGGFGSECG